MWKQTSPALSRLNSFTSETSGHSGPLSVMDLLNLWNDDPEEVLLDLGFGSDEPDLSGRIPARFINYQSEARGINLQVFLEAQKSRLDLENPDVSNRFRQLEVLQQVTTVLSSLVGTSSSALRAAKSKGLSPEALERRRHVGQLFRRASKKSLQANNKTKDLSPPVAISPICTEHDSLQPPPSPNEQKVLCQQVERALAEEQEAGCDPHTLADMAAVMTQEGVLREGDAWTVSTLSQSKKYSATIKESYEREEVLDFDESSGAGSHAGKKVHLAQNVIQTNSSCPESTSDEPDRFILSLPQHIAPTLDIIKAEPDLSEESTASLPASSVQPDGASEKIKPEDKDAASSQRSAHFHGSEGTVCFSSSSNPVPALSPSPVFHQPFFASSPSSHVQSDFFSVRSGSTQSEEPDTHEKSSCVSGSALPLLPSSPYTPSCTAPPLVDPRSQSPENNVDNSIFLDTNVTGLTSHPTNAHKEEEEIPSSAPFQLDMNTSFAQHPLVLNASKCADSCTALFSLPSEPSFPVCWSAFSSQLHDPADVLYPAVITLDPTETSMPQLDGLRSHEDNTVPPVVAAVQTDKSTAVQHLSQDTECNPQVTGEEVSQKCAETVAALGTAAANTGTKSSAQMSEVCDQTGTGPQVAPWSLHELPTETKPDHFSAQIRSTESESSRSALASYDDVAEADCRATAEKSDLIEIDDLDLVFHTSVDDSESQTEDEETFQQLDTDGLVCGEEPAHEFNLPLTENSDGSLGSYVLSSTPAALESFPSIDRSLPSSLLSLTTKDSPSSFTLTPFPHLSTTVDTKPSSRSVSVQMSSSPSSHIVYRKDIPYVTESKRSLLPSALHLDTSTPFLAVQSWAALQMQRNTLAKNLSHETPQTSKEEMTVTASHSEMTPKPTVIFSSLPSFPLLTNNGQSHVSVDKEQWTEEGEVDRNWTENEKAWEGHRPVNMACYCSSEQQCVCSPHKSFNRRHTPAAVPYSLDELEEMVQCLRQFGSVLSNIEEQLSEDQAAVYSVLSDQDRKKVWDIAELRRAVKQEAEELEMQLIELAHDYDDSLRKKLHRLLDEQALLCSQLKILPPGPVHSSSSPASHQTVATQCCLLPWIPLADEQNGRDSVVSDRESPPGSEGISQGLDCRSSTTDKLDILGFFQRRRTAHDV